MARRPQRVVLRGLGDNPELYVFMAPSDWENLVLKALSKLGLDSQMANTVQVLLDDALVDAADWPDIFEALTSKDTLSLRVPSNPQMLEGEPAKKRSRQTDAQMVETGHDTSAAGSPQQSKSAQKRLRQAFAAGQKRLKTEMDDKADRSIKLENVKIEEIDIEDSDDGSQPNPNTTGSITLEKPTSTRNVVGGAAEETAPSKHQSSSSASMEVTDQREGQTIDIQYCTLGIAPSQRMQNSLTTNDNLQLKDLRSRIAENHRIHFEECFCDTELLPEEHAGHCACADAKAFAAVAPKNAQLPRDVLGRPPLDGLDPSDVCGICLSALIDPCRKVHDAEGRDEDVKGICPLVRGVCSHSFHQCCVLKWFRDYSWTADGLICPVCKESFEFRTLQEQGEDLSTTRVVHVFVPPELTLQSTGSGAKHLRLEVPVNATIQSILRHEELQSAVAADKLAFSLLVSPQAVFWPCCGQSDEEDWAVHREPHEIAAEQAEERLAPRVLALCGVNSKRHQMNLDVKAEVHTAGGVREATITVASSCKIQKLLVDLGYKLHLNPLELSIRQQASQAACESKGARRVAELFMMQGEASTVENGTDNRPELKLVVDVQQSTTTHIDFYTAQCRLDPHTHVRHLPAGQPLYVSFRNTESLRKNVQHIGVASLFGAGASWHPFGAPQSSKGMSIFLSALFALSKSLKQKKCLEMLGHFRRIVKFPPAVWTLNNILTRSTAQIADADKSLIATAMYSIMRQQAPQTIPDDQIFEHARVFFAFLLEFREPEDAKSERFVLVRNLKVHDNEENVTEQDEEEKDEADEEADTSDEESPDPSAAPVAHFDTAQLAALYSPSFHFADEFRVWVGAEPPARDFLHRWDELVESTPDCIEMQIVKPLSLQRRQPVLITRDEDGTIVAYTGIPGCAAGQVTLFCPLQHCEVERDLQNLANKIAHLNYDDMVDVATTSRQMEDAKEAVVVCLDCSNSMLGSSGFKSNETAMEDEGVRLARLRKERGFDEREPDPDSPQVLQEAVARFAMLPLLDDLRHITAAAAQGSASSIYNRTRAFRDAAINVLADWCRLQQASDSMDENNDVRLISKYKERFVEVLEASANADSPRGIPHELLCPITCDLMEDPVVAADGFTYEREAIETWLSANSVSPMTRSVIETNLTPNNAVRTMSREWQGIVKDVHPNSFLVKVTGYLLVDPQSFRVSPSTTVAALAHMIKANLHISHPISLRNSFGLELEPSHTMQESGVHSDAVLEAFMKPGSGTSLGGPIMVIVQDWADPTRSETLLMHSNDTVESLAVKVWRYGKKLRNWGSASTLNFWHGMKESGDNYRCGTSISRTSTLSEYPRLFETIAASAGHERRSALHMRRLVLEVLNKGKPQGGPEEISRIDAVKQLFYNFRHRLQAYGYPVELGLVTFSDTATTAAPLSGLLDRFHKSVDRVRPNGDTALYDAIELSAGMLTSWRTSKGDAKLALRIVCLSDGEDTKSSTGAIDVANLLRRNNIILDAVHVGSNSVEADLLGIAKAAGGYYFRPRSIKDALRINELETFLHVLERPLENYCFPTWQARNRPIQLHELRMLSRKSCDECTESKVPPRLEPQVLSKKPAVSLEAAVDSLRSGVPQAEAVSPLRVRRIVREMGRLLRNPHESYDVYPGSGGDALSCWRVVMEGPSESPYAGGCWLLNVVFPAEYPHKAPEVRFSTPIRHANVNAHGRVCHSILDRNWAPDTSMTTVLNCVFGLLLEPDQEDPVDTSLSLEYHKGGTYEVAIQEHVRKHCNVSRAEWRKKFGEAQDEEVSREELGTLKAMTVPKLKELCKQRNLNIKGLTLKQDIINRIIESQESNSSSSKSDSNSSSGSS